MSKFTILSALLVAVQGANIADIYGNYMVVNMYPGKPGAHACFKVDFSEDGANRNCQCADGRDTALVKIETFKLFDDLRLGDGSAKSVLFPLIAVDSVNNVASLTDVTCKCGDAEFRDRGIAKILNNEYLLAYLGHYSPSEVTKKNYVDVFLMAKQLPSSSEVENIVVRFDELKDWSNGTTLCSKEIFEQFKSNQ